MATTQLPQELQGRSQTPQEVQTITTESIQKTCCDLKTFSRPALDLAEAGQLASPEESVSAASVAGYIHQYSKGQGAPGSMVHFSVCLYFPLPSPSL